MASAPTIVAESLAAVPEPLATALRPGPVAEPAAVAAALARSLAPPEADVTGPPWLWPAHAQTLRRIVAAINRHGGALLADPVGTGKTYVALAAAVAVGGARAPREMQKGAQPAMCFVPAALVPQWCAIARRLGVPAIVWSHERVSRGSLPTGASGLVIIDESQHYRNAETQRYRHLAPWLVGRRALLLSATPVVNRMTDLAHQLCLAVRDDALAAHGVPSIMHLLQGDEGHPALGQVVFSQPRDGDAHTRRTPRARPAARSRVVRLDDADLAATTPVLSALEGLRLSAEVPVAALVRGVFWRAAASSPAALHATLSRYRRLLLHARDAAAAGVHMTRRALLQITEGLGNQLLLWELVGGAEEGTPLSLDDLDRLDGLLALAAAAVQAPDPKVTRLAELLADGHPTIVFAGARATVRYLRDRLPGRSVAWCTGERAGIGPATAPRATVLGWFRRSAVREVVGAQQEDHAGHNLAGIAEAHRRIPAELIPLHLIATDVAAEGLDLRRAARVVHYDLPWTPMRLEQREGRVRRAASVHREVELVRFDPPPAVERRLRQLAALEQKQVLPARAGLGGEGRGLWRWRAELAAEFAQVAGGAGSADPGGIAAVRSGPRGVLAGFTFHAAAASASSPMPDSWVIWLDGDGAATDDCDIVAARLRRCLRAPGAAVEPAAIAAALERAAPMVRERLRALARTRWRNLALAPPARHLVARLQAMIRPAVRRRDATELALLERALQFAAGGHTAGETALVEQLARAPIVELRARIRDIPMPTPRAEDIAARLTGLVLFLG
ncbi:MAG TPA: helicase-related protein [Gemmatimonadales bacterium]|nr:helicase-related protein [Gemmatimonadales bacterium]